MRTITAGDRVIFIEDCEVRRGVIITLYYAENIAIVKLNNGETRKVEINKLGIDSSPIEQEEKEEPKKPEFKTEITITRDEFKKSAKKVIKKESAETDPIILMTGAIFMAKLEKTLFSNVVEND